MPNFSLLKTLLPHQFKQTIFMKTIIKLLLNLGTGMLISGMTIFPAVLKKLIQIPYVLSFRLILAAKITIVHQLDQM